MLKFIALLGHRGCVVGRFTRMKRKTRVLVPHQSHPRRNQVLNELNQLNGLNGAEVFAQPAQTFI
jgi:hypothetical protein